MCFPCQVKCNSLILELHFFRRVKQASGESCTRDLRFTRALHHYYATEAYDWDFTLDLDLNQLLLDLFRRECFLTIRTDEVLGFLLAFFGI